MSDTDSAEPGTIKVWFAEHLPPAWPDSAIDIVADNDEILVIVDLDAIGATSDGVGSAPQQARQWREATRDARVLVAAAAEERFGCKVSWGARTSDTTVVFTMASVPVMTRLRLPERQVLDTLIDAGVARSRSEALAWCVRLVADNESTWITELKEAFAAVAEVRAGGPESRRRPGGPSR